MLLSSLQTQWQMFYYIMEASSSNSSYSVSTTYTHGQRRGRPIFIISKEQLEYLHSLSFSWTQIALLLGLSRMTVYRRCEEFNILDEEGMPLSDSALDEILNDLHRQLPYTVSPAYYTAG